MTPEEALQILDHAASLSPMGRLEHIRIQQAAQILQQFLVSTKEEKGKGKAEKSESNK